MSVLSRMFGNRRDDREEVRRLWHRVVEIAREPDWYAQFGLADTVGGRFDAVTLVLALVLLRMEREPELIEPSARLTELFVEDMDGHLRQSGVGDLVVGKHMGKLMSVLGGRLGALRTALAAGGGAQAQLVAMLERNMTLGEGPDAAGMARKVIALHARLAGLSRGDVLAARIA